MVTKLYKLIIFILFLVGNAAIAQQPQQFNIKYIVTMEQAADHYYHVTLKYNHPEKLVELKMCKWTPGYYQIINFADAVRNFSANDDAGNPLQWSKPSIEKWNINNDRAKSVTITYDVKAIIPFVGNLFLDEKRGYITPGGIFMYTDKALRNAVSITMKPYSKWQDVVATGLDTIKGERHTFYAENFDVLYDSPFLMGDVESLPPFRVQNIPHYFVAYQLPPFDRQAFMDDLKKIIEQGSKIIGEIPYTHYTFLSIGRGGGGIEHLNSSSLSFSGSEEFNTPFTRQKLYNFIAHEYFHHYNVKRIRPIELGPFDYSKENHTNMLWVSEGFTVYYEYMIVRHAGLMNDEDVLNSFQTNIKNYENSPGHLYQSATQASWDTWADGPFGRIDDEINKTISYYDKGPVLGLMLNFAIRHATSNKKSLDDVMRVLYYKYYKHLRRGFTESEFREECEKVAGEPLTELFEYASTVKPVNYPKYFAYAGLTIDTATRALPGAWLGIKVRAINDTLVVAGVDYNSPAWKSKIRRNTKILQIEGGPATVDALNKAVAQKSSGDALTLMVIDEDNKRQSLTIRLLKKEEKSFKITRLPNSDPLQTAIFKSWMGE